MPYKTYTPRPGRGGKSQTQQPVQNQHLQATAQQSSQPQQLPQPVPQPIAQSQPLPETQSLSETKPQIQVPMQSQSQPPLPPSEQPPLPPEEDASMEDAENVKRPPWFKKPGVLKLSKAVRKKRVNARLKRMLTPKNAMMVLNELKPGVKYNFLESTQATVHHALFTASIDLDGKCYTGQGQTKGIAKQVAAENALRDIVAQKAIQTPVIAMVPKEEEEEESPKPRRQPQEDETPWGSLASFAIYKLFTEWQSQGYNLPPQLLGSIEASLPETSANGEKKQLQGVAKGTAPLPTKKIPPNPTEKHPVMLLNELRPGLTYQLVKEEGKLPNMTFVMGIEVDGTLYEGQGKSKKEAKKETAIAALSAAYGIKY